MNSQNIFPKSWQARKKAPPPPPHELTVTAAGRIFQRSHDKFDKMFTNVIFKKREGYVVYKVEILNINMYSIVIYTYINLNM